MAEIIIIFFIYLLYDYSVKITKWKKNQKK